jgi:hypothetical protein
LSSRIEKPVDRCRLPPGKVVHINETGSVLHSATFAGWQPTAVAFLKTPIWGSLLVTELKQGNVFRFDQAWGLNPR